MRSTDRIANSRSKSRFSRRTRTGFTLLEVLVATAVTLLMMVALAKIFSDIGRSMKQGRAALELNGRLRDVTYRLQTALNNATANPNSRPGSVEGRGYMELHDGPTTEHSAQQLVGPLVNRFGDVDDILMFTARAGDVWFTGKVPRFVLERRAPSPVDSDNNGRVDDFENRNLILVGSQHAEIAVWMQPVVAAEKPGFNFANPQRDPAYLIFAPGFYQDSNVVDGQATLGDGLPDAWRLHYRTLIIRPDLNLPSGVLPFGTSGLFTAGPHRNVSLPDGSSTDLPSPECDMYDIHAVCDLSVRRVFDSSSPRDAVAANSLQDLENPANRFAHIQKPIRGTSSTTMPVLALTPSLALHTRDPLHFDPTGAVVDNGGIVGSGFLHPAYSLRGERVGEDILANDVLAFDIKAYDPGVPILASFGIDGAPGVAGEDDDGNTIADIVQNGPPVVYDLPEIGWAGSDDLVLSPNDPGYAFAIAGGAVVVGTGEYVDLGWASKLDNHLRILDPSSGVTAAMNVWSPMSGYSFNNFVGSPTPPITNPPFRTVFTHSLLLSGRVLVLGGSPVLCQHSYDTWTDTFERDGVQQVVQTSNTQVIGGRRLNGAIDLYGLTGNGDELGRAMLPWRRGSIDPAIDGLDNNGSSGADDQQEFETSPPFDVPLRGIKISVRMENPGAREVRELPVSVEFVSH
ncbi:MAG: prepilin-type N-terminal cleavage/methylation domain-containing protein [Aureliella sp.]